MATRKGDRRRAPEAPVLAPVAPAALPPRLGRSLPVAAFALPLAVYLATLCPSIALVDSGELALAVHAVAPGHPPGFPLYIVVGQLAKAVPVGDLAWRLNVLSALCQASAILLCFRLFRGVLGAGSDLAALGGALALAFTRSIWRWAVVTEVYGLHLLLLAATALAVLAARRDPRPARAGAAGLLMGLAASNHLSAALYGATMGVLLLAARRRELLRPAPLSALVGGGIAGLLPYGFLPWASGRGPLFDWGHPVDAERFLRHVLGWQYQTNLALKAGGEEALAIVQSNMGRLPAVLWSQQAVWVVAGLVALAFVRGYRIAAAVLLVVNVAYGVSYQIAEDWDAYFYPTYVLVALGLARLVHGASALLPRRAVGALVAVMVLSIFGWNLRDCDHRPFDLATILVRDHLEPLPAGALVLTREWQFYAPTLYVQHVTGTYRNVTVVDLELMRRSWYYDYLRREAPDLLAAQGETVAAFLEAVRPFERGGRFDADLLQRLYTSLVNGLIAARPGRTYVGLDMEPGVAEGLPTVPVGLLFRLEGKMPAAPPPEPALLGERVLLERRLPAAEGLEKVRILYATMRGNRGIFLAAIGDVSGARWHYEQALRLDPADEQVRARLRHLPAAP